MSRRETAQQVAERAARALEAGDREHAVETLLGFLRDDAIGEGEVARLLGVSVRTLQAWRQVGDGPPYFKLTRSARGRVRYSRSQVLAYRDGLVMGSTAGVLRAGPIRRSA